jgi:hypothetical protein
MKKLIALLIVLAFVIWIPGSVVAKKDVKQQVDQENAVQYCEANDNMGYNSLGRCVRVYMACYGPGNTEAVCICTKHQNEDPIGFYNESGFNNLDECINFQRHGYVFE